MRPIPCSTSTNKQSTTMGSSNSKVEAMKPLIFKAGIPLSFTLAGFILGKIATSISCPPTQQPQIHEHNQELDSCEDESFHSLDSECLPRVEDLEQEVLSLRCRIEDIQDRECQLERQFLYFQDLKDQETVLIGLLNKMMLEMNRVGLNKKRFERIEVEYLKLVKLLEFFRLENGKLNKRIKKLLMKRKEHSKIMRKQSMQIQSKEAEISGNQKKLELMEDEIKELRHVKESATSSKVDRLQKHEATEDEEHVYLRWSTEVMRRNKEQEHTEEFGSDNEINRAGNHVCSRKRKLIAKMRRWMEGSERSNKLRIDEKEKDGHKCFPRHSVSDGVEETYVSARKSCSSA